MVFGYIVASEWNLCALCVLTKYNFICYTHTQIGGYQLENYVHWIEITVRIYKQAGSNSKWQLLMLL